MARSPVQQVYLVYGRRTAEGPEPLVAVATSETGARSIEREVTSRHPGSRIMWEVHELDEPVDREVHAVILAASGRSPDEAAALEEPEPIAVAVFARRSSAEAEAARLADVEQTPHYLVRSLPLAWRRTGWPFDAVR